MPILKYRCSDCGRVFDELVTERNRNSLVCPDCNSGNLERAYQGKCLMQGKKGGSGCSGCCSTCSGCH